VWSVLHHVAWRGALVTGANDSLLHAPGKFSVVACLELVGMVKRKRAITKPQFWGMAMALFITWAHDREHGLRALLCSLNDFEQKQNENNGQDEAESAAAVVPKSRPHPVPAKPEHQNQYDKNNKHLHLQGE
jgi:hypothetical protein